MVTAGFFSGTFRSFVPVTLTSDRSGLVMESGGKVKMRGVEVGRVASISAGSQTVSVQLEIYPDQIRYIPANVQAQIRATPAFGAKYVDLISTDTPSPARLAAGAHLASRNVSTEVNTVFQNLVDVLHQVDPPKLNSVLTALADGVRGQGQRIGEATTAANDVLLALNPRSETLRRDWRSFGQFSKAYAAAAQDIVHTLDAASTTSQTITSHRSQLNALLLNTIGFADAGIRLIGPSHDNFIDAINTLAPTADLLMKYNPEYTCLLQGAKRFYDQGSQSIGGNGRTVVLDAGILWGNDPFVYPDNLPVVAGKGGPGGKPGCGSLPDVSKQWPVRALVTNTGWGTGLDIRPNPGIGHPWFGNYFKVTKGTPEPPRYFGDGPPAPGPIPYPGAPPYGAPLYGPGGVPLWPGVPPAPVAPEPGS
ncbi:MAG: phospholipid/cholesterol/gamma-HCH transport system substrate-binding protein [Mycobacterium sp.]|nr:phospholipid/cholesterol/gamma-HCH transport system substrate-binding protein [Mycobacterium sp.]